MAMKVTFPDGTTEIISNAAGAHENYALRITRNMNSDFA